MSPVLTAYPTEAAKLAARNPTAHQQSILTAIRNANAMGEAEAAEIIGALMLKFSKTSEVGEALLSAFIALEREMDAQADELASQQQVRRFA